RFWNWSCPKATGLAAATSIVPRLTSLAGEAQQTPPPNPPAVKAQLLRMRLVTSTPGPTEIGVGDGWSAPPSTISCAGRLGSALDTERSCARSVATSRT